MNASMIIESLTARGFALAIVAEGIRVTPSSALTDADREAIRAHKPQLLALLQGQQQQGGAGAAGSEKLIADLAAAGWPANYAARIAEVIELARGIPAGSRLGLITVLDTERWVAALTRDALDGPRGARARTGVLLEDLAAIAEHTTTERRQP